MSWFRIVIALSAVVVALSVASIVVRGAIDWHKRQQPTRCERAAARGEMCLPRIGP
jgi:hypothetical protein